MFVASKVRQKNVYIAWLQFKIVNKETKKVVWINKVLKGSAFHNTIFIKRIVIITKRLRGCLTTSERLSAEPIRGLNH